MPRYIKAFYSYRTLCDFGLIYPAYMVFFQQRGLTLFECSALIAIWSLFALLLEIPSGALADRFGRQKIIFIGMIFKSMAFVIWYFSHSFEMFALGFLFWAIQEVFASGALEALIYDNLKSDHLEGEYEKIIGRGHAIHKLSVSLAVIIGGFLSSYSFEIALFATSGTFLLALVPIMFLQEKTAATNSEPKHYISIIKEAVLLSRKSIAIRNLLIFAAGYYAVIHSLDEFIQLYLGWHQMPIKAYGIILVAVFGIQAVGNFIAGHMPNLITSQIGIFIVAILSMISLIIGTVGNHPLVLLFFVLTFFFYSIIEIRVENNLQKNISSEIRATVLSIFSLTMCSGAVGLAFLFSFVAKHLGLPVAFRLLAGIAIVTIIFLMLKIEKVTVQKEQ